jgi:hypothetical protein
MNPVACRWCSATAVSAWTACVEHWTQPWKGAAGADDGWLCRECTWVHDALCRRLVMLLCAAAVRLGFLPAVIMSGYGTPGHCVWLDFARRGREGIVDLADVGLLAQARAYADLTTIPPERAVLVRNGPGWRVEEATLAMELGR